NANWKTIFKGNNNQPRRFVSLRESLGYEKYSQIPRWKKPFVKTKNFTRQMRICTKNHSMSGFNAKSIALKAGIIEAGVSAGWRLGGFYGTNIKDMLTFKNFGEIKTDIIFSSSAAFINAMSVINFPQGSHEPIFSLKWLADTTVKNPHQFLFINGSGLVEETGNAIVYYYTPYNAIRYGKHARGVTYARYGYALGYNLFASFAKLGIYNSIKGLSCLFPGGKIATAGQVGLQFSYKGAKSFVFYFFRKELLDGLGFTTNEPPPLEEIEKAAGIYLQEAYSGHEVPDVFDEP
ncbi:MAG: hypothetical protein JXA66_08170, partial [Oligoflexia bacterium]|nr:hypothetical protein [Oligoflexia bacterium]